jgi:hypothetical protein
MSVTFSLFGYVVSFQLFKNLFVPIERLDMQSNLARIDDLVETDIDGATPEANTITPLKLRAK